MLGGVLYVKLALYHMCAWTAVRIVPRLSQPLFLGINGIID